MNSDMSILIIASSLPNMNSASACGQLGLADAGGAEEDERADRARRVLEAGARAADRLRDRRDRLVLADDALVQRLLHLEQPLATPRSAMRMTGMPVHIATTSAMSSSVDDVGLVARSAASASPARMLLELLLQLCSFLVAELSGQLVLLGGDRRVLLACADRSRPRMRLLAATGGVAARCMRTREAASSTRSIALSGRKRSGT